MGLVIFSFSYYSVFLGILISVLGTTLTISTLLIWRFMVIGSLSVCGWLKTKVSTDALVLYFVISVVGSLLFLVSSGESFCSSLIIHLSLLLKLGLAPFQFWVIKVLSTLDISRLCFFLGPLKVGLLWLTVNIVRHSFPLSSLSFFVGLIVLWVSTQAYLVLYASGSCQLLILVLLGPSAFALYYSIYIIALIGVSWFYTGSVSPFFAFLGLGGLPPLTIFWAKVFALVSLPFVYGVLVISASLLRLFPYIRCSVVISWSGHSSLFHRLLLILIPIYFTLLYF